MSEFCFIIFCKECKQKILVLNSSEKFIVSENIGHVHYNMVNSKQRYHKCLLIKICRPHCIVFTFHKSLSDEKLPEMKQTIFPVNLKLDLGNQFPNKPSLEKWSSECTTFEWEANWWSYQIFIPFNNMNISPISC